MADLVLARQTVGNTVTLVCTFRDSAGTATDPDGDVTLRIYGPDGGQVGADITLARLGANRTATGKYEYEYVVPDVERYFDYQYSAVLSETVELGRAQVPVSRLTQE